MNFLCSQHTLSSMVGLSVQALALAMPIASAIPKVSSSAVGQSEGCASTHF
jgi:hypothetical protein